jgi:hypothetical protein
MKTDVIIVKDMRPRIREVDTALYKTAEARGHKAGSGGATINGEYVGWSIHEPSVGKKVPLTKKEFADRSSLTSKERERGWKRTFEPSGSLVLLIEADFHSQTRIADTRKRLLESRIEEIIDRLETIASETIQRRKQHQEDDKRAFERQKRREERKRVERIEDRKWDDFVELAEEWERACQLRRFVARVAKLNEASPNPSGRVQEWLACTRDNVDALDPLADGIDGFLERLFPPQPSEYELNFGEPEDIDD